MPLEHFQSTLFCFHNCNQFIKKPHMFFKNLYLLINVIFAHQHTHILVGFLYHANKKAKVIESIFQCLDFPFEINYNYIFDNIILNVPTYLNV